MINFARVALSPEIKIAKMNNNIEVIKKKYFKKLFFLLNLNFKNNDIGNKDKTNPPKINSSSNKPLIL